MALYDDGPRKASAPGVEHPEAVRERTVGAHALGELVVHPLELAGLEALLLGPLVDVGLVLQPGARHRLAERGVLLEGDTLHRLEAGVVRVVGALGHAGLHRRGLRLGRLLRRRGVLGRLGGAAERALDVLEESHDRSSWSGARVGSVLRDRFSTSMPGT